ncbi:MAG: hypothetical protein AAGB19_03335 [Cyanobacteria bacterium P01_F01_bin.3]
MTVDSSQSHTVKDNRADYKRPSKANKLVTSLALVLFGAGAATAGTYTVMGPLSRGAQSAPIVPTTYPEATPVSLSLSTEASSVAEVVQAVGPAVVRINASRTVTSRAPEKES